LCTAQCSGLHVSHALLHRLTFSHANTLELFYK
jgi:hypothetical protein